MDEGDLRIKEQTRLHFSSINNASASSTQAVELFFCLPYYVCAGEVNVIHRQKKERKEKQNTTHTKM